MGSVMVLSNSIINSNKYKFAKGGESRDHKGRA